MIAFKILILNLYHGRHILWTMFLKDLKARYTGSLIGPLWAVATPLYQMLLYTFLFSMILKVRFEDSAGTSSFVIYLLAGLIPWTFFSEATVRGASVFLENAHIIKKVRFPIEICVFAAVLSSMMTFFIYLILYLIMLALMGILNPVTVPLFIIPFVVQTLLTIGLSLGLGSVTVFFRDTTQMLGMLLNLGFFMTPIVYPLSAIPAELRWIFSLNPFYGLVEIYRDVLIRGQLFSVESLAYPFVIAVIAFISGYALFSKTKDAFKDIL